MQVFEIRVSEFTQISYNSYQALWTMIMWRTYWPHNIILNKTTREELALF